MISVPLFLIVCVKPSRISKVAHFRVTGYCDYLIQCLPWSSRGSYFDSFRRIKDEKHTVDDLRHPMRELFCQFYKLGTDLWGTSIGLNLFYTVYLEWFYSMVFTYLGDCYLSTDINIFQRRRSHPDKQELVVAVFRHGHFRPRFSSSCFSLHYCGWKT